MTPSTNLFTGFPNNLPEELIDHLVDTPDIRIERIVSTGHASPPRFWYNQSESEWVIVLRGEAVLACYHFCQRQEFVHAPGAVVDSH